MFRMDSPLMRGLTRLADLMLLNVLALVCSIPIVTIGASSSALYYAMGHLIHDEGTPTRDFFRSFKQNFVQATGLWLLFLAAGAALGFAFVYYLTTQMTGGMVLLMLSSLVLLLWGLMLTWVFPLQAKFTNTFWKTLNNALLLSVAYLPRTLAALVVNLIPVLLYLFYPQLFIMAGILWIALWFSVATWINLKLLQKPMDKMIQATEENAAE